MPLVCPDCNEPTLKIIDSYDYPGGDETWDELSLQIVVCQACDLQFPAIYQESRRGASDTEYHSGFRVPEEKLLEVRQALHTKTPEPYTQYITKADGSHYDSFPLIFKSGQ